MLSFLSVSESGSTLPDPDPLVRGMDPGAHKYQCRQCESSTVHENAIRGHKGANKGRESAHSDCGGAQRGC